MLWGPSKLECAGSSGALDNTVTNAETSIKLSIGTPSIDVFIVIEDGSMVASGIYFYKMVADEYVETRKMVLMR